MNLILFRLPLSGVVSFPPFVVNFLARLVNEIVSAPKQIWILFRRF